MAERTDIAIPEHLLREWTPQVLGAVVRRFRDFAAAEDGVQEALLAATVQWPQQGMPDNPRAWLIQVAARRITDQLRSDTARRRRESEAMNGLGVIAPAEIVESDLEQDDTLSLLFMCCHPTLTSASAIALTLRAVGGLSTSEIAKAFFVPEATMAQRITRAKQTIKSSAVPFHLPTQAEQAQALKSVLHVLYLIFNEGYTSSSGPELQRTELSQEAIRLTRVVHKLLPDEAEVAGLLALMLLTDARRQARTGARGELIPLTMQDRCLWNREQIDAGVSLLTSALAKGAVGPYQLQAAIAAVHDEAPSADETDWPQILALYELLKRMSENPMVLLNHAVAVAMVQGTKAALELLEPLERDERLAAGHRLEAVRAHLLELAGAKQEAIARYRLAAGRTASTAERDYLIRQAARLEEEVAAARLEEEVAAARGR